MEQKQQKPNQLANIHPGRLTESPSGNGWEAEPGGRSMGRGGKVNGGELDRPGHNWALHTGSQRGQGVGCHLCPTVLLTDPAAWAGEQQLEELLSAPARAGMLCQQNLQVILPSCWPAETGRAPAAGRGCGEEGSLSSRVSEQPDPPADFLHHTLASLAEVFPLPAWGCSLPPWTPCTRGAIPCSTKRECVLFGP